MDGVVINIKKCDYICFSHECYNFFGSQEFNKFIVTYCNDCNTESIEYGLLEVFHDCMGNTVCMLNGQLLYNYGDKCRITGYTPVKINI